MTGFLGEFEATLDAKGRFLLPAGFKKQLAQEEGDRFVINRGFEKCLSLYPMKSWEPLFADISKLKDIVLVAAVNKIEIWDSSKYHQLFESISSEAFSSLAKDVMADGKNEK